jgi:hypothetical protein
MRTIPILNSDKNEWYNFAVDNTTTMKNIKEMYAQKLELEASNASNIQVWISSMIVPNRKKEWPTDVDHFTLYNCHILKPEARAFIIVKSV